MPVINETKPSDVAQNRAWVLDVTVPEEPGANQQAKVVPKQTEVLTPSWSSTNDTTSKVVKPTIVEVDKHLSTKVAVEGECCSLMFPQGRALSHPAGPLLLRYATQGYPVECGQPWTKAEMRAAVEKGPHISALDPDAARQFRAKAAEKEQQGVCKIVKWDDVKDDPPTQLKISLLAAVPHKLQTFRAILDLSYQLQVCGQRLLSVNESSVRLAPPQALDQMGDALPRLIEAMANAPESDGDIVFSKLDIKDGYWRMAV